MATQRQKKLAQAIVENALREQPLTKKELVVSSGYSEISAESSAHILMEQKGVIETLNDFGFNEDSAKKVVAEILNNGKAQAKDRLKASELIFKVQGSFAPEKSINLNATVEVLNRENPDVRALRMEYEQKLKDKLLNVNIATETKMESSEQEVPQGAS